jgi:PST family polysaccharide transporter
MNLIKTSIFTGLSTFIKIISGFVLNKMIAIYIGPGGLALIGQLQNFITITMTYANGAITNGIVKYVSEYKDDEDKKTKTISSGLIISLFCSVIISLILILFNKSISFLILKTEAYNYVFILFGITVILYALNAFLLAILNGLREIKKYVTINILSSIFGLIITALLIIFYQLKGALIALVINQSVVFFITIIFVLKSKWYKRIYFFSGYDRKSALKLLGYSLMAITTVSTYPLALLIIRNYIGHHLSWNQAGYWEGLWRISEIYLMLITTSLSVYYLPRLSELKSKIALRKEIFYVYKIVIPFVILMSVSIFIFRSFIIKILFTPDFMPMLTLFKFQLIGDVFKISAWILSYILVAKAKIKIFIISEIIFCISFVLSSYILINIIGLEGVTLAYAINYIIYFFCMIFIFRKILIK